MLELSSILKRIQENPESLVWVASIFSLIGLGTGYLISASVERYKKRHNRKYFEQNKSQAK